MNALYRLRPSSPFSRTRLLSITLLLASSFAGASGIPRTTLPPLRAARPSLPAVALFERNDAARAERLARLELNRHPHELDALFVSMEAARLHDDNARELQSAITLCKVARQDDPRVLAAALRLTNFGVNSETLRHQRVDVEALAAGNSVCANAAREALYEAALDGLPGTDTRVAAEKAGWLVKWTITRISSNNRPAEQFEFTDARIQLPDYFPRASMYSAEAEFLAPVAGQYVFDGETKGANLTVDANDVNAGMAPLEPGLHRVRVTFRGGESRIRIHVALADVPSPDWTKVKVLASESIYLRALLAFSEGRLNEASDLVRYSKLQPSEIGKRLVQDAGNPSSSDAQFESASAHPSCGNLHAALNAASEPAAIGERLQGCAPDSLAYAQWLASVSRHGDAIHELVRILQDWPLDRDAHRMLIAELQRAGNNVAADRAAAEFLTIAPNARNFRRMAQSATATGSEQTAPFYENYRRPAPQTIASWKSAAPAVILLQDKVAIARPDGSVSLYLHRVVQLMNEDGADQFRALAVPEGGQLLTARVVNNAHPLPSALKAGDEVEEEYVVNYTGDGGMIAHPEAFQYVFNDFDFPLLDSRFIVLSPSNQSPGYVIASGPVPDSTVEYADGLRAQIWQKSVEPAAANALSPAIVRVVENENGWSIPPSVERKRILETIHPGPRNREA